MTGANRFLGMGIHFYFQPRRTYELFPFAEKRENPEDKYFTTPFRLYLMPVIPASTKSLQDLEKSSAADFEVVIIEWRQLMTDAGTTPDARHSDYYWAQNLCKTFEADLGIKPKLTDMWYPKSSPNGANAAFVCTFAQGNRELKVSSFLGREVSLRFNQEVINAKEATVETQVRRLHAPAIRPY